MTATLFDDDFTGGLGADWLVRPLGSLPAGDGVITAGAGGLAVEPAGRHETTGEPAFELATDHVKWNAILARRSSQGLPGFDVPAAGALTGAAEVSARVFGAAGHPFGPAVAGHAADFRLAAGVFIAADLESGVVLDFLLTSTAVYAYYERLPRPGSDHASFAYAVPVASRQPDDWHRLSIALDGAAGVARWAVDGEQVLVIDKIGYRCLDDRHLVIDQGGVEQPAAPRQLTFGLGLLCLLHAAGPDGTGLVPEADSAYRLPRAFVGGSPLWGQGARLRARRLTVQSG
ncbi:DUF6081 family protein [Kutzneria buriramensis]|uniref:Concanavalin A-like lectin/glucanase superfamily protein n=1 Tax=Kutzneria buriramensis TaxID=1045776 RepID=A0A3E0GWN6_9PSEU|nr:DUF6081 family protein [Kutzneria buriramensis]REH32544.1 hypothetical protein BCF44_12193 [Kutzneria buriramensis]